MLAVFIGRVPRFYLEALLGHAFDWTNTIIVGGVILLICWAIMWRVSRHLRNWDRVRIQKIPQRSWKMRMRHRIILDKG